MGMLDSILYGLSVAINPWNLLFCFVGVFLGTFVGVLPGVGPVATMSILLPLTFGMRPESAIIMLSGIFYGAQYGGSTTSILVRVPGEASAAMSCIDGYQMTLQGRAGPALGIAAIGSFTAGTLSVVGLMFLASFFSEVALKFGPQEYFALIFFALTFCSSLGVGSRVKAFAMTILGMVLGLVGIDSTSGIYRFTFGLPALYDGIGLVPVVMGLFGIGELLLNVEKGSMFAIDKGKIGRVYPSVQDWVASRWPILRGTLIGFFLGIIPGGGSTISTFASYAIEKKLSRHPERFGHGAIEGVAGPESANNAAAGGGFVPLLALGIPPNVVTAFLLGALMIHGIQPGPLLISDHPEIFWGVICSMYIGNVLLLALNLPLIGLWVQVLKVPFNILFQSIIIFCLIGVYSTTNSMVDIIIMLLFGIIGYIMNKLDFEPAPLAIGMIMSPLLEGAFTQSLTLADGRVSIFFTRPVSGIFMIVGCFGLAGYVIKPLLKKAKWSVRHVDGKF